jgi:CheY-like chemotaxis protein
MKPPGSTTILAIDNSLTIRKLVDLVLKAGGYNVILAGKGESGLKLAQAHVPDLILLDYVLPDIPRIEVCRQLLADPATASIPYCSLAPTGPPFANSIPTAAPKERSVQIVHGVTRNVDQCVLVPRSLGKSETSGNVRRATLFDILPLFFLLS